MNGTIKMKDLSTGDKVYLAVVRAGRGAKALRKAHSTAAAQEYGQRVTERYKALIEASFAEED